MFFTMLTENFQNLILKNNFHPLEEMNNGKWQRSRDEVKRKPKDDDDDDVEEEEEVG